MQSRAPPLTRPNHRALRGGCAHVAFCRAGPRTALAAAFATSPLRLLSPRNHGHAAWVFLASFGGGLVDGDHLDVRLEVGAEAFALVGTPASTKVYRSPHGCSQRLEARVAAGGALVLVPDPVVCFAGARYEQRAEILLEEGASLWMLDGYTCGRSARGERWQFAGYASRTTVRRGSAPIFTDATRLDPAHGPIGDRFGRFDAISTLVAIGPRFASVREVMLSPRPAPAAGDRTLVAASPLGAGGAVLRVAAERCEGASRALRASFDALARELGDHPLERKW